MGIWLTILLRILPALLGLLIDLFTRGKTLSNSNIDDLNQIIWYANQIEHHAVKMGCVKGGLAPPAHNSFGDHDMITVISQAYPFGA